MFATKRVHNSKGETVGFYDNKGNFCYLDEILYGVKSFDNLKKVANGQVRSTAGALPVVTLKEVYEEQNKVQLAKWSKKAPFRRDIVDVFNKWYNGSRDVALYVQGSRQVGKTSEILKFAYEKFDAVLYLNLAHEETNKWVNSWIHPGEFLSLSELCDFLGMPPCEAGEQTVIVMDEIQASLTAYNNIRKIMRLTECSLIVTGSYLGSLMYRPNEVFYSVGSIRTVTMYPMSFKEYCRVWGKEQLLLNVSIEGKSPDSVYVELTELYRQYLQIGGYPAVAAKYMRTKSLDACIDTLKDIADQFVSESMTYIQDAEAAPILKEVMSAALKVQIQEKRGTGKKYVELVTQFIKADIKGLIQRDEVRNAISWLYNNGMLQGCGVFYDGDIEKPGEICRFYFSDVGLANYIASKSTFDTTNLQGLLAETFVCCELRKLCGRQGGKIKTDTPFFSVCQQYELDFLLVTEHNKRYGVEVKSKHGANPKSLLYFKEHDKIDYAVVAEITRGGVGQKYNSIPIYAVATAFPYADF